MKEWEQFLAQQVESLGQETVDKWLKTLFVCRFDARNLHLEAADSFQQLWFEEHIRPRLKQELRNGNNRPIQVHLTLAGSQADSQLERRELAGQLGQKNSSSLQIHFEDLDPHATFETFLEEKENQLPLQLLKGLALGTEAETELFNPIYLYGGDGSGKSHLLMACCAKLRERGHKALYVRAQTFTHHVVQAMRYGEMSLFRNSYRNVEVLLIDDVDYLSGKLATQEEFFHTFNTLHMEGHQLILAAPVPPGDLEAIEPRLTSRFEWGIVLQLTPLSSEQLSKLLLSKMAQLQLQLSSEAQHFLLDHFSSSSGLTKALELLALRLQIDPQMRRDGGASLTSHQLHSCLAELIAGEQGELLTFQKLLHATAQRYGIPSEEITGEDQRRECVQARYLLCFLARRHLKLPYEKIGHQIHRHHSSIISGVRKIDQQLKRQEPNLMAALGDVERALSL